MPCFPAAILAMLYVHCYCLSAKILEHGTLVPKAISRSLLRNECRDMLAAYTPESWSRPKVSASSTWYLAKSLWFALCRAETSKSLIFDIFCCCSLNHFTALEIEIKFMRKWWFLDCPSIFRNAHRTISAREAQSKILKSNSRLLAAWPGF